VNDWQRGSIRHKARYFQGFDHSGWGGVLERNITPSDIDVVFDNKLHGRTLFCEFSSSVDLWKDKPSGQRILYMQLLRTTNYSSAAVLCRHNTPADTPVNSLLDVVSFHVMRCVGGQVVCTPSDSKPFPGGDWVEFVKCFYGLENGFGTWTQEN